MVDVFTSSFFYQRISSSEVWRQFTRAYEMMLAFVGQHQPSLAIWLTNDNSLMNHFNQCQPVLNIVDVDYMLNLYELQLMDNVNHLVLSIVLMSTPA